jgi:hypothetical protein
MHTTYCFWGETWHSSRIGYWRAKIGLHVLDKAEMERALSSQSLCGRIMRDDSKVFIYKFGVRSDLRRYSAFLGPRYLLRRYNMYGYVLTARMGARWTHFVIKIRLARELPLPVRKEFGVGHLGRYQTDKYECQLSSKCLLPALLAFK